MSKIKKIEPQYISISSLENLKIEGLCQIRSGIVKEGESGSWNSIKCKKMKINDTKYSKNWYIDLKELIKRLKEGSIPFRSYKTSIKLLSELKKLYPHHFIEEIDFIESTNIEKVTKKRKDREEILNDTEKKKKLNEDSKNDKENLFIDFIGNIQEICQDKDLKKINSFEDLYCKLSVMIDNKFLEIKNILIQTQKVSD
jgi:hemerythrin